MYKFNAINHLVGIDVVSQKHHRNHILNRRSVQRELVFCRKRTQNVVFPDSVGSAIIKVNGCLNLTFAPIALDEMTHSARNQFIYTLK